VGWWSSELESVAFDQQHFTPKQIHQAVSSGTATCVDMLVRNQDRVAMAKEGYRVVNGQKMKA
jgi:hypothetical protein